jgi:hypothetical protein
MLFTLASPADSRLPQYLCAMPNLTPSQIAMQRRFERLIGAAAPFLDVVLGVGERISRIAEPTDHEYYPIRPGGNVALPGEPGYDADADLAPAVELPERAPAGTEAAGPTRSGDSA